MSEEQHMQWESAMAEGAYCGSLPLPTDHPLVQELGLQVKESLTCMDLMESAYYGTKIPTSAFPRPWPLRCFHCGSDDDVQVDSEKAAQHSSVRPQCAACRASKVKLITVGKSKQCVVAPDARRVAAENAATTDAARKKARQPAPPRKKSYEVAKVVGKAKQGKYKKVHWKDTDTGALCGVNQCTWTAPSDFDGDAGKLQADWLVGKTITLEDQGTIFAALVEKVKDTNPNVYQVKYNKNVKTNKATKKKSRWVDFELPPSEKTSWWRVDGYETEEEDGNSNSDDEEIESSDEEDEGDMEVDE